MTSEHSEIQTGFVDVTNARLHYKVAGAGDSVVLLHAGIADSRMWNQQIEAFAAHFRVVAFDWRGYGQSDAPNGLYALHEDLAAVLDHLNIGAAHLIGASMGGGAAIDFTLTYPQRVSALVLVGSAVSGCDFTDETTRAAWRAMNTAYEQGDMEKVAQLEMKLWVAGSKRELDAVGADIRALVREMLLPTYAIPEDGFTEKELDPPAIDRLHEITAPTLVIAGDYDTPDILRMADLLSDGIADAHRVDMHGVAHLPNMEQPDAFNQSVLTFLQKLERK